MNRKIARIMSMILALTLALSIFIPGRAEPQSAELMSSGVVNLAYFYKPPTNSTALTLARNFDFLILSGGDEAFRDQLVANGYSNTIPQYFGSVGIQDPGSCFVQPRTNQVAYNPNDFCWISRDHPDWFLLDTNGRRILASPGSDIYRMDPGNPEWRHFFAARVITYQAKKGWSGLFLDNLEASLSFIQRDGHTLAKYPNDASYQAAIRGFLEYLKWNYARPYNRPMVANIIARRDEASWFGYIQYLDGAMQESWAVDWNLNQYISEDRWKSDLALAEKTQSQGKHIILVSQGNQIDTNRQKFAYASYLLVSNGKAAFRYGAAAYYRQLWFYDNYRVDLGTPLGPRYQTGSLWRRNFTKGYVIVDPVNHTALISNGTATPTPIPTSVVQPTATPTGTIYDDRNPAFIYTAGWQVVSDERAYQGSFHLTTLNGAIVRLPFTGQSFSIIYKGGINFASLDVYVDGVFLATLNQKLSAPAFQQRWDYPGKLTLGNHVLKLIFKASSGDSRGSLDAVIIR